MLVAFADCIYTLAAIMVEDVMAERVRSPRYPSISLGEAEELARKAYGSDGMNAMDREVAVKHMGYSSLNGASAQALASLKQYGLISEAGKGMVRLTDLALDVIEPQSESAKRDALRQMAFRPDLFAGLRERFPGTVPSESNLRAHLVRQQFTQAAIRNIVPAYLGTCEYVASLSEPEKHRSEDKSHSESLTSGEAGSSHGGPDSRPEAIRPGVRVQWTSGSTDQLKTAAKVLGLSDCGNWVFTDQGSAGIPIDEVRVVEAAQEMPENAPLPVPPHILGLRDEVKRREFDRTDVWREETDLDEGQAVIVLPVELSVESVEDLEYWLKGVMRKARRRAGVKENPES